MSAKQFLKISSDVLSIDSPADPFFWSWCAWTTFSRLKKDSGYWTAPLPLTNELLEKSIVDGGMWTQPFFYEQIAHIIIPRVFTFDKLVDNIRETWEAEQDVDRISTLLSAQGIQHNISQYAVDLKLF